LIKLGCNDSLPADWKWVKANDIMDVRDGTHDSPKSVEKGIPLVTSKNLVDGKIDFSTCNLISEADHEAISRRSAVDNGDILYAMIGTIGNPVIVDKKNDFSIKNVALFKFTKSKEVCNKFVYHLLNSDIAVRQFQSNSRGGTQKFVSLGNIRGLQIPLPPLTEQKRIAAILDKADAIRRKRQQAIQLADDFLRTVFLDMFGDPVTNPKGWEVKPLSSLCKKITDGTHHSPPIVDSGIPYVTAKHLKLTGLEFDAKPWYISEESHRAIFSRCNPEKNDVLYIKDGATTGLAAINEYDFEFSMLSSLALLKPDYKKITSEFLCMFLNHPRTKLVLTANMAGAAITRLTLAKIKDVRVPLPDLETQKKFTQVYANVRLFLNKVQNSSELTNQEFNSLSQKVFAGEL
jgi:type I restriction enzyme S subunit